MRETKGERQELSKARERGGLKLRYVYRVKKVPDDPRIKEAIDTWADAWGEYVWQNKKEGEQEEEKASPDLKRKIQELEKVAAAFEKLLPDTKFLEGFVN